MIRAVQETWLTLRHKMNHRSLAVLSLWALTACAGTGEWPKPATSTTCDDWKSHMTEEQRVRFVGTVLHDVVVDLGWAELADEHVTDQVIQTTAIHVSSLCGNHPGTAVVATVLREDMEATADDTFDLVEEELGPLSRARARRP